MILVFVGYTILSKPIQNQSTGDEIIKIYPKRCLFSRRPVNWECCWRRKRTPASWRLRRGASAGGTTTHATNEYKYEQHDVQKLSNYLMIGDLVTGVTNMETYAFIITRRFISQLLHFSFNLLSLTLYKTEMV